MDSVQLNELANKIRKAGGKPTHPVHMGQRQYTPSIGRVYIAHQAKKISVEEAQDLNPKYDPDNHYRNTIAAAQVKQQERDPAGVYAARVARTEKRKASKESKN